MNLLFEDIYLFEINTLMRQYINIVNQFLFEAQTPTGPSSPGEPQRKPKSTPQQPPKPTDEPPDPFDAFEPYDPFAPKPEQPLTGPGAGATPPSSGEGGSKLPGKTSTSARDVHMRGELPPEAGRYMGDFLGRQHDPDDVSDEEAMRRAGLDPSLDPTRPTPTPRPEIPRNPENLPAVIGQEMMARNDKDYPDTWEPNWTMVRHLPGYLQNAIRAMGRQVFRQFTNTPLEDIQIMASPMINSEYDLNRMAAFIRRYGIKDDEAVLDFMQSMPGYNADVALYRLADYEFLVVRDFAGHYIYGWPGGRGVHLSAPRTPKRLRENQKKKAHKTATSSQGPSGEKTAPICRFG